MVSPLIPLWHNCFGENKLNVILNDYRTTRKSNALCLVVVNFLTLGITSSSLPQERNNNSFVAMKEQFRTIDAGQRVLIAGITSRTSSVHQMAVGYCFRCTQLSLLSQTTSFTDLYMRTANWLGYNHVIRRLGR